MASVSALSLTLASHFLTDFFPFIVVFKHNFMQGFSIKSTGNHHDTTNFRTFNPDIIDIIIILMLLSLVILIPVQIDQHHQLLVQLSLIPLLLAHQNHKYWATGEMFSQSKKRSTILCSSSFPPYNCKTVVIQ
jgi:hypothetical protein